MVAKTTIIKTVTAFALSASLQALAQQPAAPVALVKPVPQSQEGLFMPGFGNEGVITARYTVKADGSTADIEIVGGFSNPFYDNAIKEAIANWKFTPGTVDGEPRDFFNQEQTFSRRVSEQLAISEAVQKEIEPIRVAINAKDYATARDTINRLLTSEVHSVLDYALMNDMLATVELGLEDPFAALEANKRATQSAVNMEGVRQYMLTPELLQSSLKRQLVLAATVRQQGEVLRTWQELDALFDLPADDPVMQWVETARQQLAAPDQLAELGKIVADKHFVHVPAHRIFTVADVREGSLDKVVAHCERRTLELDYQEGVDWTLPAGFGDCKLDIVGDNGTLFTVYEFAQ